MCPTSSRKISKQCPTFPAKTVSLSLKSTTYLSSHVHGKIGSHVYTYIHTDRHVSIHMGIGFCVCLCVWIYVYTERFVFRTSTLHLRLYIYTGIRTWAFVCPDFWGFWTYREEEFFFLSFALSSSSCCFAALKRLSLCLSLSLTAVFTLLRLRVRFSYSVGVLCGCTYSSREKWRVSKLRRLRQTRYISRARSDTQKRFSGVRTPNEVTRRL